jgi:hypothetical protein
MGKLGERHEADALIGILLEYRNLVAGLAAELAERLASSSDRRRFIRSLTAQAGPGRPALVRQPAENRR